MAHKHLLLKRFLEELEDGVRAANEEVTSYQPLVAPNEPVGPSCENVGITNEPIVNLNDLSLDSLEAIDAFNTDTY